MPRCRGGGSGGRC
uniref:Uncharacterized protein n=1 Tax=Arundo donax TaxID=35708 RepID=A0A0A9CE96_ARUDO